MSEQTDRDTLIKTAIEQEHIGDGREIAFSLGYDEAHTEETNPFTPNSTLWMFYIWGYDCAWCTTLDQINELFRRAIEED